MSKIFFLPFGIELPKILTNVLGSENNKEKVYVIGNGWGSYYFVKNLNKKKFEPIIIAPNIRVLNTPKLTNLLIDPDAQVEFDNSYGKIIPDMLSDINVKNKKLITKSGSMYNYKYVVMSIGSESNDFGIRGVQENTYKFKTIKDANIIREKLLSGSINSNIFIVGSGVTGIELGSKLGSNYNVKIIEGMGTILPGYNEQTKKNILDWIEQNQKYIQIKLNSMVKSIESDRINIISNNITNQYLFDNKKDLTIWTGGIIFNGFGKTILYKTLNQITPIKPRGLDVTENFSIGKSTGIFCIGDMVGNSGPPTAQNARLQGEWLAGYFNSDFDKKYLESNKFVSESKGKLVHIGSQTYLESKYYSGFLPRFVVYFIELFNK